MSLEILRNPFIFKIKTYLSKGNSRSVKLKKNILAIFLIKGFNILITMLMVSITIDYLNPTKYGIWITLSSIIGWFSFFDIGLGHGLRNRFTEALANNDKELARVYVSTTYGILSIIVISSILLFLIINPYIDWSIILNTSTILKNELSLLALIVFVLFCVRFVLNLISIVLIANQRPALAEGFKLIGNILALLLIYLLTKTTNESLLLLGLSISLAPVIILIASSFWFFNKEYSYYRPSIKYVKFKYVHSLMNLGIKFFIIQISGVIIYQSSNIIISQIFSPADVTPYNIAYKYFSLVIIIFGIITNPFWSAYTDAYTRTEMNWVRKITTKMIKLWGVIILGLITMTLFANNFYDFWIGGKVKVPLIFSILLALFVAVMSIGSVFVTFLNGIGKIKLQLYISVIQVLIFIPLAILLTTKTKLGIPGVIIATIIVNFFGVIFITIQYYKIIKNKADGIWNQ